MGDPPAHVTGAALGLRLVGEPIAGLPSDELGAALPEVGIKSSSDEELLERWSCAREPRQIVERLLPGGGVFLRVWRSAEGAYRIWAPAHGHYLVEAGGARVWSGSSHDARSARLLAVGQLLPLLALLHGGEVLHAGAARLGGRVVALTALPGTGKSTTLARLLAGGADFVADDTLAVRMTASGLVASSGPRTINLHEHEALALGAGVSALGIRLGATDKVHFEPVARAHRSEPLSALLVLDRSGQPAQGSIEPAPDPAVRVLASFYAGYYDDPLRLERQLSLVEALLAQAIVARVVIGANEPPASVAARIAEWAAAST